MTDDPNTLAIALRAAITASVKSRYALAKETEVPESAISRFLAGADMQLAYASRLAEALGLELLPKLVRTPRQRQVGANS